MKRLVALGFVLVLAPSAFGQILFDNVTSGTITGTTLTINHTIGGGSNRLVVLEIAVEGNNVANSALTATPTFNAVPFNLAVENVTGSSFGMRTLIYYMLETDLPAAGTYAVSITAALSDNISAGVVSVTAAEQQPPEVTGSNDDNQTGASTIQTIITTLTDGAWLFDCVGSGNAVSGFTPDAGQTERWDVVAASSRGAGSTREEPTAGAVTMGWTTASASNRISHVVAAWAAFVPCVTDGDCDDANACTDDTCGAGATCQHVINNANPCDDGDLCTSNDECIAGSCAGIFDPACSATGFQSPSSTAARQGPWTTPTNAFASNNTFAKSGTNSSVQQDWTNFGLSIPTAATVDGIEVRIEHRHKKDTDTGFYTCQLIDGGGLLGLAKDGPDHGHRAEAIEILPSAGGPMDTWGTVLTDAVVESPAFGISCHYTATTAGGANRLDVDHLQIIVYYTPECAVASDCDDGNQCTLDACVSQSCQNDPLPNGTTCNDGDVCVVGETCQAGVCGGGAPADCSGAGDQCNTASCDTLGENEGNCDILTPANQGLACDDGQFCTTGETCSSGICGGGSATDCSGAGDQCNNGVCNETTDACEPQPANEGLSCDDGQFCTTGETCTTGTCGGGSAIDCSGAGDQCNVGVCNETTDACEPQPANEGLGCDDGLFCTSGETCTAGACGGGSAIDCSGADDQCNTGVCNETSDACEPQSANEGLSCDDGLFCNTGEICTAGACGGGSATDCSGAGDQCNTGVCNETTDACEPQAANEGLSCDDSVFCNGTETCNAGTCVSTGDPCPPLTCDEIGDVCLPAATVNGLDFFYSGRFADAADPTIDFLAVGSISDAGNVSNYMRGITGIRVLFDTTITFATTPAAAFSFEWTTGEGTVFSPITDPGTNVTVTALDSGGTTTVTVIITDDHVQKRWLKVSIDSAQVTGNGVALDGEMGGNAVLLPSGDAIPGGDAVFFVGNQPGDVDDSGTTVLADMGIMVPNVNPFRSVPITNIFDVDKSGMVLLADLGQARLDVDIFFELPVISP